MARRDNHLVISSSGHLVIATAAIALALIVGLAGQKLRKTVSGDWPMYNYDLAGTRHSPLTQINTRNVGTLAPAWSYKLGKDRTAGTISGGSEYTPIVVAGVMYVAASDRVVALEPETGKEIWRYTLRNGAPSRRGVTYWSGTADASARIFVTSERRLIALNASTGAPATAFGNGGEIDMVAPYNSAPTLYKNLLIVGTNGSPGGVRAFDARNGMKVWDFHSVPTAGEPAAGTWKNESWKDRPNTYSWAFSQTLDAARGFVYVAVEAPGPSDYWGADRPGDNLYGNSLLALDAATGKLQWHFQTVHHDLWDYDLPSPPSLLDVTIGGQLVPVLAQTSKTGYMYVLNRVTGKPVFGIEERRVSKSDVPDEESSPTQPVPVKPPPLARVSFKADEIVRASDTTAEHAAFCQGLMERSGGFYNDGPFTPYVFRDAGASARSTILFPGSIGGANWGGTAADPGLGYVFVNTNDEASIGWVEKSPAGARVPFRRNSIVGPTSRFQWAEGDPRTGNIMGGERGWLCQRPPWGNLVAVNVRTGDIAWKVPLGVTDELPEGKKNTGRLNLGGPITTAGGLIFIGATNDKRFRAFDAKNGRELWTTRLAMSAHAVPMTYQGRNGKQYVAITASGASALDDPMPEGSEALVVFALP
jgi:glucose dehydrogenase